MFDTSKIETEKTIYERVAGSEKDPKSKWLSRIIPEGRLYYTGRTIHTIQSQDGLRWFGISKCNPTDAFDKVEGKRRARDRAFGAFQRYRYNTSDQLMGVCVRPPHRGLQHIAFHNYKDETIEGFMLGNL